MSPSKRPKLGAVTHEVFTVQGINGKSTMNRLAYDEYRSKLTDRRSKGRYTLEEAAMQIAEATRERADKMLRKLESAALSGQLDMYEPSKNAKYIYGEGGASGVRDFYEEAYWNDLNTWLVKNESRVAWQFPDPQVVGQITARESRNVTILSRFEELKKNNHKSPTKTVAEEFRISDSRVRSIVRTEKKKKSAQTAPSIVKELTKASGKAR